MRHAPTLLAAILVCAGAAAETAEAPGSARGPGGFFEGLAETHRYEGFVMPMGMPYFFEEPFITTGLHALAIRNELAEDTLFSGGYANIAALEARLALNRRIGIIAPRDGYFWFRPGRASAVGDVNGFGDLSLGVKVAALDRPQDDFILSLGALYRTHSGSRDVFNGHGDGAVNAFVAAGKGFGRLKLIANLGGEFPLDGDANSTFLAYGVQASYVLTEKLRPLVHVVGLHYLDGGRRLPLDYEGLEVANLGSSGVDGNDVIWGGIGLRYELTRHVGIGAVWEHPLSAREDILKNRLTLSLRLEL